MSEQYQPVETGDTATSEATPEADLETTEQELVTEPAGDGVVAEDESPAEESTTPLRPSTSRPTTADEPADERR